MTAGAPLGRFHAGDVLHILDAFAIPLIVERRKVVRGTVPLFVNVGVAAFASLRLHKVFCRNVFAVPRLRGTRKELPAGAVAFAVHGLRGHMRIDDAIAVFPRDVADPPGASSNSTHQQRQNRKTGDSTGKASAKPAAPDNPRSR